MLDQKRMRETDIRSKSRDAFREYLAAVPQDIFVNAVLYVVHGLTAVIMNDG